MKNFVDMISETIRATMRKTPVALTIRPSRGIAWSILLPSDGGDSESGVMMSPLREVLSEADGIDPARVPAGRGHSLPAWPPPVHRWTTYLRASMIFCISAAASGVVSAIHFFQQFCARALPFCSSSGATGTFSMPRFTRPAMLWGQASQ